MIVIYFKLQIPSYGEDKKISSLQEKWPQR